ncbi:oxidoreductase [Nocardioides albidus]|uniref:Oxidoreductase n=1 Tax=Nocardioides albidus TaxID=1517589 RepID=A0A5C4VPS6_9ACTN|nr:PDR/VanB family oxidoreductase [Nocardioides albidus]TNM37495.1 oxidoreductase [Nocardioides albidus]
MSEHIIVRVAGVVEETAHVRTLRLEKLDGAPFTRFRSGAHIDVVGPTGVLRQYSLASSPLESSSITIAVKLEPEGRGGSAAMHEVKVGDHLKIGKPRNLLSIADDADQHLLVAGGIGVTPLLAMAYELYTWGADFELHYFTRSREEMAFAELLSERVEFRDRVHLHVGVPRDQQPEILEGIAGRLTSASHVYTCGPVGFMDQVRAVLAPTVGDDHVHIEHFEAAEIDTSGDSTFTVELDTGESYEVPADKSILAVLEENGIEVFKSCEEGVCGSCVSGLLEGTAEHRDNCLTESDRADQIALCVSRAASDRLVIELY